MLIETKIEGFTIALNYIDVILEMAFQKKLLMSQAKLRMFKSFPTKFLFEELFKLEVNYMHPINLPIFPKELLLERSEIKKGLDEISAFAISKYLIRFLSQMSKKNIFQRLVSQPQKIFFLILKSKSKFLK